MSALSVPGGVTVHTQAPGRLLAPCDSTFWLEALTFVSSFDVETSHCTLLLAIAADDASNKKRVDKVVWLPSGDWVSWGGQPTQPDAHEQTEEGEAQGRSLRQGVIQGPTTITASYGLADTPVYVRAGAVVPTRTMASAYHTTADPLVWMLATGAESGNGTVWEDDGESLSFREGEGASTSLRFTSSESGHELDATVSATNGSFSGMASSRAQWLVVHGLGVLPVAASCNGKPLAKSESGVAPGFWLADSGGGGGGSNEVIVSATSVVIACASAPTAASVSVKARF